FVRQQYYGPGLHAFTTNWWQAYDIGLTNGLNIITVQATDRAGNTSTLTTDYTLDYTTATNAPTLAIAWPADGTLVCGNSFTCRGTISDPTAAVTGQITDTNGDVNVVAGLVERNGNFWLENLPLNPGTNVLTLTAVDAAGNTNALSLSVEQSALSLTMTNVVPDDQLWDATVNVGGTISDAGDAIEVNGVPGVNNGDGTWSAANV